MYTLADLNHMDLADTGNFMNILIKCHFHNASKEDFWPKIFEFDVGVQMCYFGNYFISAKMTLMNLSKKLNFFWPFLWSIMKAAFSKNIHKMFRDLVNPWFMSDKVQIKDFLKKSRKIWKENVLGPYEFLECLEG